MGEFESQTWKSRLQRTVATMSEGPKKLKHFSLGGVQNAAKMGGRIQFCLPKMNALSVFPLKSPANIGPWRKDP